MTRSEEDCRGLTKIPVVIGENIIQKMIGKNLKLPRDLIAIKLRNIETEVRDIQTDIIKDKIIIHGTLHKQFYFIDANHLVRHFEEALSFSELVSLPGAEPDMEIVIQPTVEHIITHLLDQGKEIHHKTILQFFIKILKCKEIKLKSGSDALFKVDQLIGKNQIQTMVTNETVLSKPAEKIVEIQAKVKEIETEVIEDKVLIQGIIEKQVFYIGNDQKNYYQEEQVPFSDFIDLFGAESGMNVHVDIQVEHIDFQLKPGNKLNQKIVLKIKIKVTDSCEQCLSIGKGPLVMLPHVIGDFKKQFMNDSSVELDQPAVKIKEIDASVLKLEITLIKNKAVLTGILHKQIFYIGKDNVEYHQAEDIPFTTFIDTPKVKPGMNSHIEAEIVFIKPTLSLDGAVLHQIVFIDFFLTITENVQITLSKETPIDKCGVLEGIVTDPCGKPVKDVLVKAVNQKDSSQEFLGVTNKSGFYAICVPPGTFSLHVLWCSDTCFTKVSEDCCGYKIPVLLPKNIP